jgi:glutamate racemase
VLGCTHYPLIKPLLRRVLPANVAIVDSAESTAKVVDDLLRGSPLPTVEESERRKVPRIKFYVTDSEEKFRRLGSLFLGREIGEVKHVDMAE